MDAISPVPREARPFQGQRAGLVTRLVANTVDALTVSVVLLALPSASTPCCSWSPRGTPSSRPPRRCSA